MTFMEQIRYRAKAIIAGLGVTVVAFLTWIVEDPQTAVVIQQVVPAPYAQLVPIVLAGVAATWLVHAVPNRTPTILTRTDGDDDIPEPATSTTVVSGLLTAEDGAETSGGR